MGEEAITGRMNPELVLAVEELDRLEALSNAPDTTDPRDEGRDPKRARRASPPREILPPPTSTLTDSQASPPHSTSLLSLETLQGLRALAHQNLSKPAATSNTAPKGLLGLAEYASDDDSS